jgi:hypothetical protein
MMSLPTQARNLPRFTAANKPAFLPAPPAGTYLRYWLTTNEDQVTTPAKAYGRRTTESLNVQIPRGMIEHNLVWENVASPPWQTMQDCMNAIGNMPFLGIPAYELLFAAAQAEPTYGEQDPLGRADTWRIHYVFRRCPLAWNGSQYNWNYAWVESTGWTMIYESINGLPFYRSVDFSTLLVQTA